jgi:DNA polymerase-3 subunit delta
MIVKSFELTKKIPKNINFFLLYGSNLGLIEEIINKFLKPIFSKNLFIYDEIDLLKNPSQFYEEIFNKSFFDNDKLLIINRATDRILSIIETLVTKNLDDLKIVIKSDILEKKSKLRIFFEKNKDVIVTPFYEETHQQLASIAINFFKEKKIAISSKSLNLILEKMKCKKFIIFIKQKKKFALMT